MNNTTDGNLAARWTVERPENLPDVVEVISLSAPAEPVTYVRADGPWWRRTTDEVECRECGYVESETDARRRGGCPRCGHEGER